MAEGKAIRHGFMQYLKKNYDRRLDEVADNIVRKRRLKWMWHVIRMNRHGTLHNYASDEQAKGEKEDRPETTRDVV